MEMPTLPALLYTRLGAINCGLRSHFLLATRGRSGPDLYSTHYRLASPRHPYTRLNNISGGSTSLEADSPGVESNGSTLGMFSDCEGC